MTEPVPSCVCIWRLRNDPDEEGTYVMIKIVDDPFCPSHHPGEVIDLAEPA